MAKREFIKKTHSSYKSLEGCKEPIMNAEKKKTKERIVIYIAVSLVLLSGYFFLRKSTWQGSTQLHTLMELTATFLALMVGILALMRFYTRKNNTFLFIGTGFLGTAFLDGYHTVVTSSFFDQLFPSPPPSLIPWSWNASRMFLSILMFLSLLAWQREVKIGSAGRVSEKQIYTVVISLTLASFLFFAFIPLPRAYYPEYFFGRPEEFISALFFLLSIIGYLKKGLWKNTSFEHWLLLSLIVGFMGQAMFMPFSFKLFDGMFDIAHLLKKVSYICVLTGMLISIYYMYKHAESSKDRISNINEGLQKEVIVRKQAEKTLNEKTSFLRILQIAASSANVSSNIEDAFKPILNEICHIMGCPIGHAYMISKDNSDLLEPTATWYLENTENMTAFHDITANTKFERGRGLPGRVMASGQPHWIEDVAKDSNFPRAKIAEKVGITSAFAFPVMVGNEVVSVLEFFSSEKIEPDNNFLKILADVGVQLGRVIKRNRMEKELNKHQRHLEVLVRERTQELEKAQEELINKERLAVLGQLTATVSHEIRNPLGTVRNAVFSISEAVKHNEIDRVNRSLKLAERNIKRCDRIINELLDFTRERKINCELTNIDRWLESVLDEQEIPEDIECVRDLNTNIDLPIDRELVLRAVNNVVSNAVQALQEENSKGNQLKVISTANGDQLEIHFIDTGPGIPEELIEKIFEPLFSTKSFGIGLGVPVVKDMMEAHHGKFEIKSKAGKGTTATLSLPMNTMPTEQKDDLAKGVT